MFIGSVNILILDVPVCSKTDNVLAKFLIKDLAKLLLNQNSNSTQI